MGETLVLSMEGKLYSWSAGSGEFHSGTEESLGQFGAGDSFLGKDWIYAGSGQSLYAYGLDGKKSQKLMDYEIGLLFNSSLWLDEAAGRGILASWDSESGALQCYYLTNQPVETAAEETDNKEAESKEKEIIYLEQFLVQDDYLTKEFRDKGELLSGGERQKLAIARLLYSMADCYILDEPTSALDPIAEMEFNKAIMQYAEDKEVSTNN